MMPRCCLPVLASLLALAPQARSQGPSEQELREYLTTGKVAHEIGARACEPAAIAVHLRDPRPHVRAAASLFLRTRLGLGRPSPEVLAALADHPNARLRALSFDRPIGSEELQAILDAPTDELLLRLSRADLGRLTQGERSDAARRLFRQATRVPMAPEPPRAPRELLDLGDAGTWRRMLPDAEAQRCVQRAVVAMRLDARVVSMALATALQTDDPVLRSRMVAAVHNSGAPAPYPAPGERRLARSWLPLHLLGTELSAANESLALELLDKGSTEDRWSAASVLFRATSKRASPVVRARILDEALRALGDPKTVLAWPGTWSCCGPAGLLRGKPSLAETVLVLTAARNGEIAILQPLLARASKSHYQIVRHCLAFLHDTMDDAQAQSALQATFRAYGKLLQKLDGSSRALALELVTRRPRALAPILLDYAAAHPDDLGLWKELYALRHVLPTAQLDAALADLPLSAGAAGALFVTCPKHLVAALERDTRLLGAATSAVSYAARKAPRITYTEAKQLPDELLLRAIGRRGSGIEISVLALVADDLFTRHEHSWSSMLSGAWLGPDALSHLEDITNRYPNTRRAAAMAALKCGAEGRAFARSLLTAELDHEDPRRVGEALQVAVAHDLRLPGWEQANERVDVSLQPMARVRFAGAPQETLGTALLGYVYGTHELPTPAALRAAGDRVGNIHNYVPQDEEGLTHMIPLVPELPEWPDRYVEWVARHTRHASPAVRRHAYAALATCARGGHPVGDLAFEAVFDVHAAVRASAPAETAEPSSRK